MSEGKEPPRAPVPIRGVTPVRGPEDVPPEDGDPLERDSQQADADGDRRPTPVRTAMETEEEPDDLSAGPENTRTFEDPASGARWTAEITGQSMSGVLPLRTVPILEVVFKPEGYDGPPLKRALHQGESLAGFSEAEMIELLAGAKDFRGSLSQPQASNAMSRKRKKESSKD